MMRAQWQGSTCPRALARRTWPIARRLAEAGCSEKQIAAITGHKSLSLVAHYTKAASQEQMAVDAMAKLAARRG